MRQRVTVALAIVLAVTACQKKASGQTVAVVNNEEITAAELNDAMKSNSGLTDTSDTKAARAQALQKIIDRKLLVQQARKDGLDKTPEFINEQRRLNDELLVNMMISKRLSSAQVPAADEINRFEAGHPEIFANREIWTLNQIIYPLPQSAEVTQKLAAAKTLDEVAQALTAAGVKFDRATRKIDTAQLPPAVYAQITKVQAGEPFIAPGPGKAIANVITAREPSPVSGDQARAVALNGLRRDAISKVFEDRLKSLRAAAKIQYQPGFEPPANAAAK